MPWCPKCKSEYREGFETCTDCGANLVDRLKPEASSGEDKEVYLATVSDEMEAKIIESLLGSYDILVMEKHRGFGGYANLVLGKSMSGIDIYVPASKLEEAQEIISESFLRKDKINDINSVEKLPEYTSRNSNRKILLVIVVIPMILFILLWTFQNLRELI
jgi:hypothetical protein